MGNQGQVDAKSLKVNVDGEDEDRGFIRSCY